MRNRPSQAILLLLPVLLIGCPPPIRVGPISSKPFVQLERTRITVNELTPSVAVSVYGRARGRSISVEYATTDGTGVGGVDYAPVSGTLVWARGDRGDRTFDVPIIDNATVDGDRTLGVTLSNPSGKTRLLVSELEITILDDDGWGAPGDPDVAFGVGGVVTSDPGSASDFPSGAVLSGGSIVIVGSGSGAWRIEKRSALDGSLDAGFGTGGVIETAATTSGSSATGVQTDGTDLYISGFDERDDRRWRLEKRSLADGSPDPIFGSSGVVLSNPSAGDDYPYGIVIDATHLYVFGCDEAPGPWDQQWRVEKRTLDTGGVDAGFGASGAVTHNPTPEWDTATDLSVNATHLIIAGTAKGATGMAADFVIAVQKRSRVDGSLDASFGIGGTVLNDPSSLDDRAFAIAIDSSHLYLGGWDDTAGNGEWRLEKRALLDGSLDPAFGPGGVMTIAQTGDDEMISDVLLDSNLLYVAGSGGDPSVWRDIGWRVERRSAADGSLDGSFGQGGVIESNPTDAWETPAGILLDATGLYIFGADYTPGSTRWRIEKRLR